MAFTTSQKTQPSSIPSPSPTPFRSSASNVTARKAALHPRARRACARCYQQKLRCDNQRPCALCVRSSIDCKENSARTGRRNKAQLRNLIQTADHEQSDTRTEGLKKGPAMSQTYDSSSLPLAGRDSVLPSPVSAGQARIENLPQKSFHNYGIVYHIFENCNTQSGARSSVDAVFDSGSKQTISTHIHERSSVFDLIGMELPPLEVASLLVASYIKSVHWFQLIIHEPTFRVEFEEIISSRSIQQRRLPFLVLALMVLALGCRYVSDDAAQELPSDFDLHVLEKKLISKVEEKFLDIFDNVDIESVQGSILLSMYYTSYGDRPKRTYVVLGAALESAKAQNLHKESMWGDINPLTREIRRRVWWALYVADIICAICFGRTSTINDVDCEVKLWCDADDTLAQCPGFQPLEVLENGTREHVTFLSYQRHKLKLFQTISTILQSFHSGKGLTVQETAVQVRALKQQLHSWKEDLPPELRLTSFRPDTTDLARDRILKTFQLFALSLQILYDHARLLLYRPLLTFNELSRGPTSVLGTQHDNPVRKFDLDLYNMCKIQCWDSAMQMIVISGYHHLLRAANKTCLGLFIGMQSFTSGAVLGLFALSTPFTPIAQESKQALGRLIKIPQILGCHTLLSDRCRNIMKGLLRLILSEEMRLLTADTNSESDQHVSEGSPKTISSAVPSQGLAQASNAAESFWPTSGCDPTGSAPSDLSRQTTIAASLRDPRLIDQLHHANGEDGDVVSGTDMFTILENFPAPIAEDFDHAILFSENGFRGEGARTDLAAYQLPGQSSNDTNSMMAFSAPEESFLSMADIALEDTGQAWIWDSNFSFLAAHSSDATIQTESLL